LVFGIVFFLRFVVGGDEDTWICENGNWVTHGNPSSTPPTTGCGEEKKIGGEKDKNGCLVAAGYSWCEEKEKCLREWEEPCTQEKIFNLLSQIKNDSDIDFSGIGKTSFDWVIKEGQSTNKDEPIKETLEGKAIFAENVEYEKVNEIDALFTNEGFETDPLNIATGTYGSLIGFRKENTVCLITTTVSGYDPSNPEKEMEPSETETIKIECSEIN